MVTPFDDYIAQQPENFRDTLFDLYLTIKELVPDAEETLTHGVPCFKLYYMLVGVGVTKKYVSLYVMDPQLVAQLAHVPDGVKKSGTTIHFLPNKELPKEFIATIVAARVAQNKERARLRAKSKK